MLRGGLQPTQILFDVKVEPASTDAKPSPGNQLDPKRAHPPYRHLAVAYTIRLDGISFTPSADGQYHADFEFGIMVYTADGQLINTVSNEVRPVLTQAAYQSMLQHGAAAHLQVDVPDRGQFFLRIGVHDMTSDHVGALEVPASSIKPDPVPAVASRSNP
jgi:hypothetical protein